MMGRGGVWGWGRHDIYYYMEPTIIIIFLLGKCLFFFVVHDLCLG